MNTHLKKLLLPLALFINPAQSAIQDDFVITVKTNNSGTSTDVQFNIPTNPGDTYNYNVDCNNDGIDEVTGATSNYLCNYASSGTYIIRIKDNTGTGDGFPRVHFNSQDDKDKLLTIQQWGSGKWTSMKAAFKGTSNLQVTAADSPDLNLVIDMSQMFMDATNMNGDISQWQPEFVEDFSQMFSGASSFNQNIGGWQLGEASTFFEMFKNATSFDQDISNWDLGNMLELSGMFSGATLSVANYDTLLVGWNAQNPQANLTFDGGFSKYCAITEHDNLTSNLGHKWTITDGGIDTNCPSPLNDFIITVKTDNNGTSTDLQFEIPTNGSTYNYNVDCDNDGIDEITGATGNYLCEYASAGTYTIRIKDNSGVKTGFPRIYFKNELDKDKIITVEQWGTGIWSSMSQAFYGAGNLLTTAPDSPDFSQLSSFFGMFKSAALVNPNTTNWNTSSVKSMYAMFDGADIANPDTSNWDTSSVSSMSFMFSGANSANPNTTNWDTSNVISMNFMFAGADIANPDTSNWDTSSVTSMSHMFASADSANPNTSNWDISSVTRLTSMFDGCDLANPDTSHWDTSAVVNMSRMFLAANSANPDTSHWDTSKVTNMYRMFYNADAANPETHSWDISRVTNMEEMFRSTTLATITYDHVLIDFNNSVIEKDIIFDGGGSKYCSIEAQNARTNLINNFNWTISDGGLCDDISVLNDLIIKVKTDNTGSSTDLQFRLPIRTSLTDTNYNIDCDNDGIDEAIAQTSNYTCNYANSGTYIIRIKDNSITGFGIPNLIFLNSGDKGKIISILQWGTSKFQTMLKAFSGTINLQVTAKDTPDLSNVTTLESMFEGAVLSNPDVSDWDVATITDMTDMFKGVTLSSDVYDDLLLSFNAQNLQVGIDFNGGNSTYCAIDAHDNLTNIATGHGWLIADDGVGANCAQSDDYFIFSVDTSTAGVGTSSSTQFTIPTLGSGYNYDVICDVDNPQTSTARSLTANYTCNYPMAGTYTIKISSNVDNAIFGGGFPRIYFNNEGDKLKITEISQWGSGVWKSMESAFRGTSNMIVTATDTPNLTQVTDMSQMFRFASLANPNVSLWDTSNVTTMELMFNGALAATPNISNWDVSNVDNMDNMLLGLTLPTTTYDATLINFNLQNLQSGVNFHAGDSKYCAVTAHDNLTNITTGFGWTITDGALDTNCPPLVEDVFTNGFEDVVIFKSAEAQFVFDFSQVSVKDLDKNSLLIAKGLNNHHQPTLLIYLRNDLGQLQIRKDFIDEENQWIQGPWESIENNNNTLIHWNKTRFSQQIK